MQPNRLYWNYFLFFLLTLNRLFAFADDTTVGIPYSDSTVLEIHEVSNIHALRNLTTIKEGVIENGQLVYVIGYHHSGDRGGGHFIYDAKAINPNVEDFGINIKSDVLEGTWKRINYNAIYVSFFGALGGDTEDDTFAIQRAMEYAAKQRPPEKVNFGKGTYYVQELILKNGVSLQGNFRGTILRPYPQENGEYAESLVRLDEGYVENISMQGFMLYGEEVLEGHEGRAALAAPMNCFEFNAYKTNGGLWYSSFKDIVIRGFQLDGIRFIGGNDYDVNNEQSRVNQFITFENVRVFRDESEVSHALYMFGQNAQVNFLNCSLSSTSRNKRLGIHVWLESSRNSFEADYQNGPQTSLINFDTCTFEHGDLGFHIKGAYSINIHGCWFEQLNKTFMVSEYARGINISNNKISSASGEYLLYLDNSWVTFTNNVVRHQKPINIIKLGRERNYEGNNNYWEIPGTSNQKYFN